ncbi:UNVERIFIED_CONTAM: hypothetical protein RMT77_005138 [Armadillidium vulgare]
MDILCELLPVIDTFNIYIRLGNEKEVIENVEITGNSVIIRMKTSSDKDSFIVHLNGVHLMKNECCKFVRESNWVYFRAQLAYRTKIINSLVADLSGELPFLLPNSDKLIKFLNVPLQLQCRCNFSLTDFIVYKKICPLPTADWDHISEHWFCHLHDSEKKFVKNKDLNPKENELFFNELFFNINSKSLSVDLLNDDLRCRSCSAIIGCQKRNSYKLWTNEVQWIDESKKIVCAQEVSEILFTLLENLEKDSVGSCLRIVLESGNPKKELLYLVTMDKFLNLYVSENCSLMSLLNTNCDTHPLNSFNHISLKKVRAIKVLFKHKVEVDDESGLWVDDINVQVFQVNDNFFSSVLKMLKHSNLCFPETLRIVNDLNVGYILK